MKNFKRLLALALIAVLCLTCFACQNTAEPVMTKPEHVFKSTQLATPEGVSEVGSFCSDGTRLYMIGSNYGDESNGYQYSSALYSMNMDGSDVQKLSLPIDLGYTENSSTYVMSMTASNVGKVWIAIENYNYDYSDENNPVYENKYLIYCLDAQGNELYSIDISKDFGDENDYYYINSMSASPDGHLYICSNSMLMVYDPDGKYMFNIETDNYIENVVVTADGNVLVLTYLDGGYVLAPVDLASKKLAEETYSLPGQSYSYSLAGGSENGVLLRNSYAIFDYNYTTGELKEIFNFINSDLDTNEVNSLVYIGNNQFAASSWDENYTKNTLNLYTEVPADQIVEKIQLTLAVTNNNYQMRSAVIAFNKSNDLYRITINDYSQYATEENYNAGVERLNSDIVSGKVPDLIMITSDLSYESYVSKGVLYDMNKLFEQDEELSRDDYLTNILDALSSDGKLCRIAPFISVQTLLGHASQVGQRTSWTIQELKELMEANPDITNVMGSYTTRDTILTYGVMYSMNTFVDRDTGKCDFDGQTFIDLLEFANTFPAEISFDSGSVIGAASSALAVAAGEIAVNGTYVSEASLVKQGKQLLYNAYLSDIRSYQEYKFLFDGDVAFIGFPGDGTTNGSIVSTDYEIAISSKANSIDGAWAFVKYLIGDANQTSDNAWSLPIKLSALDKMAQKAMEKPYYTDQDGNKVEYDSTYWLDGKEYTLDPLTQEDIDFVMNYLKSLDNLFFYDADLMKIINEEVAYFFNGQKTAQEVATIIQSRAQIYLSEGM